MDDAAPFAQSGGALAGLIGARICHDLISPIGAIGNGLELLAMTAPGAAGPEFDLIGQSQAGAAARIRFFRIAFGTARRDQVLSATEAGAILGDMLGAGRLQADWQVRDPIDRADCQIGYLALLCLETALPQGGLVRISHGTEGWRLAVIAAPRVIRDPDLWAHLEMGGCAAGLTPAQVQFALLPLLTREAGRRVTVTDSTLGPVVTV